MADPKKDAAYYARDKARQAAVDKRGYYNKADQDRIRKADPSFFKEADASRKKRMSKSPTKRSSK